MKEVFRQFGGALIAAVVGAALMLIVSQVPFDGGNGVSCATGAAVGDEENVLQPETATAFDSIWRRR